MRVNSGYEIWTKPRQFLDELWIELDKLNKDELQTKLTTSFMKLVSSLFTV